MLLQDMAHQEHALDNLFQKDLVSISMILFMQEQVKELPHMFIHQENMEMYGLKQNSLF